MRPTLALTFLALGLLLPMGAARAANLTGCTADQVPLVQAAYDEAEARTRAGLEHLAREPDGDLARRWFGTAPRAEVRTVLKQVLAGLRPGKRPPTGCGTARTCRDGGIFAFARLDERRITVCPRFFNSDASMGRDTRFGTLVHEVSHLVAKTKDAAYGPGAAMQLAAQRPRVAMRNADNVEYFVEGAPMPPLRKPLVRAKGLTGAH
ncbi:M35 family metallo-endopeptidase [Roseomonas sp. CCTCC AB2023176]|uniref:M35 family metallo-endopeptidase n=1 Tax=Roseomonas sp. CCTCC AB2023176 TaxID=3342640 RepID=UPI0035E2C1BF